MAINLGAGHRGVSLRSLRIGLGLLVFALPSRAHAQSVGTAGRPGIHARVQGIVFDSSAMRPLSGALVQFVLGSDPSRVRSLAAGADGTFRFDSVEAGSYLLGFFHPRLDSVPVPATMLRVDVRDTSTIDAALTIPSTPAIVTRLCGPNALKDSTGLFAGTVRRATGSPLSGKARVRVQWAEIVIGARGVERTTPSLLADADENGRFALCGVPLDAPLMTRAFAGGDSTGYVEFELPPGGFLYRTLFVAPSIRVAGTDTLGRSLPVMRGAGALRGTIRSAAGQPVAGARVSVWSTGLEAVSDSRGNYRLASLPTGTYTMEARAIGFAAIRQPVDILPGGDVPVDVELAALTRLDTVRVRGERVYASKGLLEFEARRKRGLGYFLDEAALEKRPASSVADLLRMTPGVVVAPGGTFGDQVLMRNPTGQRGYCTPTVFVDGARLTVYDGNMDALVSVNDISGIEVYTRTSSVPAEFQSMNGCGVIVFWTKR